LGTSLPHRLHAPTTPCLLGLDVRAYPVANQIPTPHSVASPVMLPVVPLAPKWLCLNWCVTPFRLGYAPAELQVVVVVATLTPAVARRSVHRHNTAVIAPMF